MQWLSKIWCSSRAKPVAGFCIIVGLLLAEVAVHHTSVGLAFRNGAYQVLNGLRGEVRSWFEEPAREVAVVDISAVLRVADVESEKAVPYTPPVVLEKIIRQLTTGARPVAIGVDVDMSPIYDDDGARVPPGFGDLMHTAEELAGRAESVSVFFGVSRAAHLGPEEWLRLPNWARFAVWLQLPTQPSFQVPLRLEMTSDQGERFDLPSLASAMANAGRDQESEGDFADRISERAKAVRERLAVPLVVSDLGLVEALEATSVACEADGTLTPEAMERLAPDGKLVFIGKVERATDKFLLPGSAIPRAGVLFHAAGALTLREQNLALFNHWAGVGIGFLFMVGLWARHHFGHHAGHGTLAGELDGVWRGNVWWSLVAGGLALLLLMFGLLWLELLLVWAFAGLHTLAEFFVFARMEHRREARRGSLPPLD